VHNAEMASSNCFAYALSSNFTCAVWILSLSLMICSSNTVLVELNVVAVLYVSQADLDVKKKASWRLEKIVIAT